MKGKKPSPAKVTKQRIERDKRDLGRLDKKLERLVGQHSPEWLEWVEEKTEEAIDKLGYADKFVREAISETGHSGKRLLEAAEKELRRFQREQAGEIDIDIEGAMDKLTGSLFDTLWEAERTRDRIDKAIVEGNEIVRRHLADVDRSFWQRLTDIAFGMDFDLSLSLEGLDQLLGVGNVSWGEAIKLIPEVIVGVSNLLNSALFPDEDTLVEDNVKLVKLQKQVRERIEKEGL